MLLLWFAGHALASSTLTLLNKQIAVTTDFPWVVILLQCIGSVFFAALLDLPLGTIRRVERSHLPGALLISLLFTACLVSSISGLHRVHVPMAVVGRNLTPFFTAVLELTFLHTPLSGRTLLSLVVGLIGAGVYLAGDANSSIVGCLFVILNACCISVTSTVEKFVSSQKQQSPLGLCLLRNALAVPFIGLILLGDLENSFKSLQAVIDAGPRLWFQMLLTSAFGALTGLCLFQLQSMVTATTVQVAALCYKLISVLLSLLLFPASLRDLGLYAAFGYGISTLSAAIYSFKPKKLDKPIKTTSKNTKSAPEKPD